MSHLIRMLELLLQVMNAMRALIPLLSRVSGLSLAVIGAVAVIIVAVLWRVTPAATVLTYHAAIGKQDFAELRNHTLIRLNTDTEIKIVESKLSSEVALLKGEIYVKVEHDGHRAFAVHVGCLVVRDVGTLFDMFARNGTTTISVIEGEVSLSRRTSCRVDGTPAAGTAFASAHSEDHEVITLKDGDTADVTQNNEGYTVRLRRRDPDDVGRRIQWLYGRLSYVGQPIGEIVEDVNRYNRNKLVIVDPTIAHFRMNAEFRYDNPEALLDALREVHRVTSKVRGLPDGTSVIELRGPSSAHPRKTSPQ